MYNLPLCTKPATGSLYFLEHARLSIRLNKYEKFKRDTKMAPNIRQIESANFLAN